MVYQCAKTGIGIVLRSWSGLAHFCQSHNSALQALIDALYIEQLEIRVKILLFLMHFSCFFFCYAVFIF